METTHPEMSGRTTATTSSADAYSIREFCRRNHMSEATYYRLQRLGKTPDVIRLGPKKVLISTAAAERWRIAREAEARAST